ncbi:hypothetical protein MMC15_002647 [Xylographa vitiligo]|nr:hypothetical protein [Xylographa vitiligo]
MGRWSQYDEDDYRLPEGMQRVGYDADTQKYTYQDSDESYWEGAAGARYGGLRQVNINAVGAASKASSASRGAELESMDQSANKMRNKITDSPSPPRKHLEKTENDIPSEDASISNAKQKDWRLFAPFLFLVCLSLLIVYHLLRVIPATDTHAKSFLDPDAHSASSRACGQHKSAHTVRNGDTCSAIAQDYDMSVEELRMMNRGVECETLWVGDELCVRF